MPRSLQPPGWKRPRGYACGIAGCGEIICVSGQVGWNEDCVFESTNFTDQAKQALKNIVAVLAEAGSEPAHIARMTWYVTNKQEYLSSYKELGLVYQEVIGKHFPAMTAIEVKALMEDQAKLEIEVTAIKPVS
jgi:enamine deaminase RidA (YjgF/YER057c/UK114 family)